MIFYDVFNVNHVSTTTDYYQFPKDDYNRMLLKKIREEYKKCDNSIINEINIEAFEIAEILS